MERRREKEKFDQGHMLLIMSSSLQGNGTEHKGLQFSWGMDYRTGRAEAVLCGAAFIHSRAGHDLVNFRELD